MPEKILITPRSFKDYAQIAYPLIKEKGYEIIENTYGRTFTEDEIIELAKDEVVGIIVGIDPITSRVMTSCKKLRAISKYGVGMDNIDLIKAAELGIKVKNAVGTNNVSVAELAICFMFVLARNIYPIAEGVKNGGWGRTIGFELTGKKLGIIGAGQIGKEVAKRAVGLEMSVLIYDPYFNDEEFQKMYNLKVCNSLDELLEECDIISLHVPLTDQTRHIINKDSIGKMKDGAVIINTSRGELIDEDALYEALITKKLKAAASDVFSKEPPEKDEKLLCLDNFILTPHIGAYTKEAVEKMVLKSTQNLLEML